MNKINPFFSKNYSCPVCMTSFASYSVRSSATYVEKREADFHIWYRGVSPLYYSIIVCPSCEYAASNTQFNLPIPPQQIQQLSIALMQLKRPDRPDFGEERDVFKALQCFQLAVRSAQLKKVPTGELAGLLLSTAWLAAEAGQSDLESEYRREALKYYLEAYHHDSSRIGNLNDLQAAYLIGELFRREHDYGQAINWFNQVIIHPQIKSHPSIEKMARDQWALSREQSQAEIKESNSSDQSATLNENDSGDILPQPEVVAAKNSEEDNQPLFLMEINLTSAQVNWLDQLISNYSSVSPSLGREQIIVSLLEVMMDHCPDKLPGKITNKTELKTQLNKLF